MTKQNFQEFCDEQIFVVIFPLMFLESYLKHSHIHENLFKQAKRFYFYRTGTYEVKNLDMSNGNTGRKGGFFFRIEQRTGDDAKAKCNTWFEFQEKVLKDELLAADRLITPCPCVFWQTWFDSRFSFEGGTDALHFKSVIFKEVSIGELLFASVHRKCNYDNRTGLAITAEDSTLEVQYLRRPSNLVEDSTARQLCLVESNSVDKFNSVRLPDNCGRYFRFVILRSKLFNALSMFTWCNYCRY